MEKHSCCQGHGHTNYGAYIIGAIIVLLIVLTLTNSVFGTSPATETEMNAMIAQCSQMMNGDMLKMMNGDMIKHMEQMHSSNVVSGMSQEEHESHHR